jgi:pSer/pThr/pTyr-binding forkhead associated (FHA) protein
MSFSHQNLYLSFQLPSGEYQELPLTESDVITIGRFKTSTIKLSLPSVSRQHAKIFYENGSFWIEDLGSSNGSYVNKEQVHHSKIALGDLVQCGEFTMIVKTKTAYSMKPNVAQPVDPFSSLPPVSQAPISIKNPPSALQTPPKFQPVETSVNAKPNPQNQLQSLNFSPPSQNQSRPQSSLQPMPNQAKSNQSNAGNNKNLYVHQQNASESPKQPLIKAPPLPDHLVQSKPNTVLSTPTKTPIVEKPTFANPSSLNQVTPKAMPLNQSEGASVNQGSAVKPVNQPNALKSLEFPFEAPGDITKQMTDKDLNQPAMPPKFKPTESKVDAQDPVLLKNIQQLKDQLSAQEKEKSLMQQLLAHKEEIVDETRKLLENTQNQLAYAKENQKQLEQENQKNLENQQQSQQEITKLLRENEELKAIREEYFLFKAHVESDDQQQQQSLIRLEQDHQDLQNAYQDLAHQKEQLTEIIGQFSQQMKDYETQSQQMSEKNNDLFEQVEHRSQLIKEKDGVIQELRLELSQVKDELNSVKGKLQNVIELNQEQKDQEQADLQQPDISLILSTELDSALMMELSRMEQYKQDILNLRLKIQGVNQEINKSLQNSPSPAVVPTQKSSTMELLNALHQNVQQNKQLQANMNAHHLALESIDNLFKVFSLPHQANVQRTTDKMLEKNREIDMTYKENKDSEKTENTVRVKTWRGII